MDLPHRPAKPADLGGYDLLCQEERHDACRSLPGS
jgi:hypothetical protein